MFSSFTWGAITLSVAGKASGPGSPTFPPVGASTQPAGAAAAATRSDIAGALMFFTTAASAYITGQNLVVDGGVDAKFPHLIKS